MAETIRAFIECHAWWWQVVAWGCTAVGGIIIGYRAGCPEPAK